MIDGKSVRERMLREGFSTIHEYNDAANEVYPNHDHPGDNLLVVLKGSMTVVMDAKTSVLRPGDEMLFPAKVMHSAKVGTEGCLYLDGERP